MNGRLREAATGPFRISVTASQQRVLIAIRESEPTRNLAPELIGQLIGKGLIIRYGEQLVVTLAGTHLIGLLAEAGLPLALPEVAEGGELIP